MPTHEVSVPHGAAFSRPNGYNLAPGFAGDRFDCPVVLYVSEGVLDTDAWGWTVDFYGLGPGEQETRVWMPSEAQESFWIDTATPEPRRWTFYLFEGALATARAQLEIGPTQVDGQWVPENEWVPAITVVLDSPYVYEALPNEWIRLRIRPANDYDVQPAAAARAQVLWTGGLYTPPPLLLVFQGPLSRAPGVLQVTVTNGTPNATVSFLDDQGYDFGEAVLDSQGQLSEFTLFLDDDDRPAGAYLMTVTEDVSGLEGEAVYSITLEPDLAPVDPGPDDDPPDRDPAIVRWRFKDPAPDGVDYTVPINPATYTPPHEEHVYDTEHSTAPDGQFLTWEGAHRAQVVRARGTLFTEDHYLKLQGFADRQRRVYWYDHRGHRWVVAVDSFDPVPRRDPANAWCFDYDLILTVFRMVD